MLTFKQTELDLGVIEPNSKHFIEWEFENGSVSDILRASASCTSCTSNIITLNNKVQATFVEADFKYLKENEKEQWGDYYEFKKSIKVSIRNGDEPTIIVAPPPAIGTVPNPKIPVIALTFKGKIKIEK